MLAHRAHFGGLGADDDVAAVGAFPDHVAVAAKDDTILHVGKQLAIALLMGLFDLAHGLKEESDIVEALLAGVSGHLGVHVGPLVVLAVGGVQKVGAGGGDVAVMQELEPDFGVLLLVVGGLLEEVADLHIALLAGLGGVVLVLGVRLAFAGEGGHEVGLGLGSLEIVHG